MKLTANFLVSKSFGFLLLLAGEGGFTFESYHVERSLTPIGWAVIIAVPAALIFGLIYLIAKILKKTKIKLK